MDDEFFFLGFSEETIQKQNFLCIYILDLNKHTVFRIFKKFTDDIFDKLNKFDLFDDISERVCFVIKREGKISLDIKI